MARLLFEKTGSAVWISHLDLMRLFQRAFKRAGFPLTHTQGYNPRPSVSIALPLSVGTQSHCELLDFELEGGIGDVEFLREKLNRALVSGVRVLDIKIACKEAVLRLQCKGLYIKREYYDGTDSKNPADGTEACALYRRRI